MAKKNWLAKLLLFAVLEVGALAGMPLRPEDIEHLNRVMHGTVAVEQCTQDQDDD